MYYLYHPYHYPFPSEQIAYHPLPAATSVHPELVNRPMSRQHTAAAKPTSSLPTAQKPQYPPVNPNYLYESAQSSRKLMSEASILLNRLATSKEYGTKLMEAAQRSDKAEVTRLIRSVGITADVDTNYNPDGLRLEFISKINGVDCCRLLISLRWR
jgi:hypothetical protein